MSAQTLSFGGVGGSGFSGYPPISCSSGEALPNNSTTPANADGQRYVRIQSVSLGLRTGSYPSGFKSWAGSSALAVTNGSQLSTTSEAVWYTAGSTISYGAGGSFTAIYNFNRTGTGSISDAQGTTWVGDLQASISIVTFPNAPSGVTVTSFDSSLATLSWTAPSDNGGGTINGYAIQENKNGTGWFYVNGDTGSSATSATVTVDPSSSYQFRVGAITTITRASFNYVGPVYTIVGALSSASASITTPASTASVPNLAGLTASAANTAITNAGFTVGTVTTTTVGAYSGNNATVASQSPTSGTSALLGSAVSYQLFDYVAPTFPPVWSDSTLAAFTQLSPYSDGVSATNSPTYSVSVGSLPAGISLNTTTGAVTGTPTTTGSYSFTLRAANVDGAVTQAFSGTVGAPVPGKVWVNVSGTWQRCNVYVFNSSNAPVLATVKTTTNGTTWTSSL
jgi:hypothetical protein